MGGKWSEKNTVKEILLEPGFWTLTKGGLRHHVLVLLYPNSIQVLGMEQPTLHLTLDTLNFTLYDTLYFTPYTLHFTLYTLHFTLYS